MLMPGSKLQAVAEGEDAFERVAARELIPEPEEVVYYSACWAAEEHRQMEMQEACRRS